MSSTTFNLFLLATAAFAKEDSLLRGNRALVVEEGMPVTTTTTMMEMKVGINEMVCEEAKPYDGSVVCVFRSMPPSDGNVAKIHQDCLYSAELGTNYCVATEFYRIKFGDVVVTPPAKPSVPLSPGCPEIKPVTGVACAQHVVQDQRDLVCEWEGAYQCKCELNDDPTIVEGWSCGIKEPVVLPEPPQKPVVLPEPPQEPVVLPQPPIQPLPQPINGGGGDRGDGCPFSVQPGTACAQFVPAGSNEQSCLYGRTQCNCALQDGIAQQDGWVCRTIGGGSNTNGSGVTFDVNSGPIGGTPSVVSQPTNSGQILPKITNAEDCSATKPDDGTACEKWSRCTYYTFDAEGNRNGAVDCDCGGERTIVCRTSLNPIFGQDTPSF